MMGFERTKTRPHGQIGGEYGVNAALSAAK